MTPNLAQFRITYALLREALHLPENCQIIGIAHDSSNLYTPDSGIITVVSEEFPEHTEGEVLPFVYPSFILIDDEPQFVGWGLE